MTDEEYLKACGWTERAPGEWWKDFGSPLYSAWTLAEALKRQLAEDRERLEFVLSRSRIFTHHPSEPSVWRSIEVQEIVEKA